MDKMPANPVLKIDTDIVTRFIIKTTIQGRGVHSHVSWPHI